jgi:hypothetical protein
VYNFQANPISKHPSDFEWFVVVSLVESLILLSIARRRKDDNDKRKKDGVVVGSQGQVVVVGICAVTMVREKF